MQTRIVDSARAQSSREFSKRLLPLTAAGGAAFWIIDFVMALSLIGDAYKAAFFISSLSVALLEALIGGSVIALVISFLLLRFPKGIPGKTSLLKALILCFGIMAVIEILTTLGDPANARVYLLLQSGMNSPRFLALGLTIGYLLERQNRKV